MFPCPGLFGNILRISKDALIAEGEAGSDSMTIRRICSVSLLLFLFMASLGDPAQALSHPIKVVTSFYPVYIMAMNVAQGVPGVLVTNLTPSATGCLHDYAVTTRDMKKLADAQVFIANGAGMESFLERITDQYPKIRIVTLAAGISLLKGAGGSGDNPHVWVSISNAIREVQHLGEAMEAIDPVHAALYRRNAAEYVGKLETLRERMKTALAPYQGTRIVTFHEAFPYFAKEFGFQIAAVVEREPGSAPGAKELSQTIDIVRKSGIKALFSEPQYSPLAAQVIAKETGAKVYVLDPGVSGPDIPDAYLQIMEKNLEVLKHAFSK